MGSFRITAQQPAMTLKIHDSPVHSMSEAVALAASDAPSVPTASDPLAALLDSAPAASRSAHYLERLSPRTTRQTLGSDILQLELGYQSKAPELLTSAQDPGLLESLKALNTPPQNSNGHVLANKTLMTGAVVKPDETVAVRVGIASAVDPRRLQQIADNLWQLPTATRSGVYAGLGIQTGPVATSVVMDTALGQPRVGVGMALSLAESMTIGISYLNQPSTLGHVKGNDSLRIGAELVRHQDTVLGANLNQSLQGPATDLGQTAVGLYLNTRFR